MFLMSTREWFRHAGHWLNWVFNMSSLFIFSEKNITMLVKCDVCRSTGHRCIKLPRHVFLLCFQQVFELYLALSLLYVLRLFFKIADEN